MLTRIRSTHKVGEKRKEEKQREKQVLQKNFVPYMKALDRYLREYVPEFYEEIGRGILEAKNYMDTKKDYG